MPNYYSDMAYRRTCVYRFYDAADRLLYVGLSLNLEGRITQHRRRTWWPEVVRCDVCWFDNRAQAKAAEREAIADEDPIYNIVRPGVTGLVMRDITPEADAS